MAVLTGESIMMACDGCGKEIVRPGDRVRSLVECSKCKTISRTIGMAMQSQASSLQLTAMRKSLRLLKVALWMPLGSLLPCILLVLFDNSVVLANMIWLMVNLFALCCVAESRGLLGRSKSVSVVLFLFVWPAWLVSAIITYFKLKKRFLMLSAKGARDAAAVGNGARLSELSTSGA